MKFNFKYLSIYIYIIWKDKIKGKWEPEADDLYLNSSRKNMTKDKWERRRMCGMMYESEWRREGGWTEPRREEKSFTHFRERPKGKKKKYKLYMAEECMRLWGSCYCRHVCILHTYTLKNILLRLTNSFGKSKHAFISKWTQK